LPPLLQAPPCLPVAAAAEGASSLGQAAWKYRHPAAARGRAGEGDEALREVYRRVVLYNYSQVAPEALGAESRASGADGAPASRSALPSGRACVPLSRVAADGVLCPHQLELFSMMRFFFFGQEERALLLEMIAMIKNRAAALLALQARAAAKHFKTICKTVLLFLLPLDAVESCPLRPRAWGLRGSGPCAGANRRGGRAAHARRGARADCRRAGAAPLPPFPSRCRYCILNPPPHFTLLPRTNRTHISPQPHHDHRQVPLTSSAEKHKRKELLQLLSALRDVSFDSGAALVESDFIDAATMH